MATIHFLNVGCADTTIINTIFGTFLIDCHNIESFKDLLPSNKAIKALFITHQHYDHFSGMEYLKENNYSIEYLIYSPYNRRFGDNSVELEEWQDFSKLANYFEQKGSNIYKPYRQTNFDKPWWEFLSLKFWMLGPTRSIANSDSRELHDASLVFLIDYARKCCFTGDASDRSLNWRL